MVSTLYSGYKNILKRDVNLRHYVWCIFLFLVLNLFKNPEEKIPDFPPLGTHVRIIE
jgi:hypothetical protein